MKLSNKIYSIFIFCSVLFMYSCAKDSSPTGSDTDTVPVISALTADKTTITYGEEDPATITCSATGGNLTYKWQVDLGDIMPLNADKSKIKFTGAACCVGEKIINCTVSNSKGSVTKSITLNILEKITTPEIISIQSDINQISVGKTATVSCNAIGGNLKYKWDIPCGAYTNVTSDGYKIAYTPSADCVGTQTLKCTVTNEKGSVSDTFIITVVK